MTVALYARVSMVKQAGKDLSIPDQLRQMRDWCKRNGHAMVPVPETTESPLLFHKWGDQRQLPGAAANVRRRFGLTPCRQLAPTA